jgi:DNA-binding SARP family transcriptional activator
MRIQLLGGFQIRAGDQVVGEEQFRLRKARNLVKLLALAPDHRLHREQVIEKLWADQEPDLAVKSFHQALYIARKVLAACGLAGAEILQLKEETLSLLTNSKLWIDVEAFETAATYARKGQDPALYREALD